jgi:toxin ParE1/3/4
MAHQVAPKAEDDLDEIWSYVARDSNSFEIATRLIETITASFQFLSRHPYLGQRRDRDFGPNIRSVPVGNYIIFYRAAGDDVPSSA